MEIIMGRPQLQGFRTWQLVTRDAQGQLYAHVGFAIPAKPEQIMRKTVAGIYKNN